MRQVIVITVLGLIVGLAAGAKEWYETAAFYQIYPQSFFDEGSGKIGTGSFKGIERKLDYLKDLGIDCLWLTPIFQSSFEAYGYDITDYKDIDPRYGTKEDFDALIRAVHEKGMRIIVDFVPNHCSVNHPFFQKSAQAEENYKDWFVWTDKINYVETLEGGLSVSKPSNWQNMAGEPGSGWTLHEGRGEYYYGQFYRNMPDFNLRNEKVRDYMKEVMKFWLDLNIDGFRVDAITHGFEAAADADGKYPNEPRNEAETNIYSFDYLKHTLTQDQPELFEMIYEWRDFMDQYQIDTGSKARILMTESYSSSDVIKKYYASSDGRKNGAHLPFNFEMIKKISNSSNAATFVQMVTDWFDVVPNGKITNWVIGNHDVMRVADKFGESRIDIMNTLVTMLPGTSVTYYGEEIGMKGQCAKFEDGDTSKPAVKCDPENTKFSSEWSRSPMQWDETKNSGFSAADSTWSPVADNYATLNVKAQQGKEKSHLEIHRQLLKLRKNKAIMESDSFEIKALSENSFAFKRELSDKSQQSVLVIINFGAKTESVDIKKALSGMPDLMTVEITGGISEYKKGEQVSIGKQLELKEFESIVAFYNTSSVVFISKITIFSSILVYIFIRIL